MSKDLKGTDSILGISEITDTNTIWRMIMAECIGTLILVFFGCGSILNFDGSKINIVQIALCFGLVVAAVVQAIGHVSGCHINPAVTLSLFITGDIKLLKSIFYIAAQCIGAAGGSGLLWLVTPTGKEGSLGITNIHKSLSPAQGVLMEAILTFLLLFVIHGVCDPRRKDILGSPPLAIGLCITACHLVGINYTGSSLNPARSFGPAVVMNIWQNHWIYWAGPIMGGALAGVFYKYLFKVRKGEADSYDF